MLQGWCKRADAVFDMHPSDDIHRRGLEHIAFGDWLKRKNNVPIYSTMPIPDCPDNVVYPKDKIVEKLLPNFRRGKKVNEYFTSGPCYALALAIYKGYSKILFYGIEMESNSEYIYQRDGIGLWFGIALGRGIQIELPEQSILFYAPLYGYDMDAVTVDREAFEARASEIQIGMDQTQAELQNAKGRLDSVVIRIQEMNEKGLSREEMEKVGIEYEQATNAYEQAIANHAFLNGQYIDCLAWKVRVEKAMEFSGKSQEILAQNHAKDGRFIDKNFLAGITVPGDD